MVHLLGTFYTLIFVLCLKWRKETKHSAEIRSIAISAFYGALLLLDGYRAWNQLADFRFNHYLDVFIHVVAGSNLDLLVVSLDQAESSSGWKKEAVNSEYIKKIHLWMDLFTN